MRENEVVEGQVIKVFDPKKRTPSLLKGSEKVREYLKDKSKG